MKRIFSVVVLLAITALFCVSASADAFGRVVDDASVLTDSEERTLQARLDELSEAYEIDVAVVVVDSLGFKSSRSVAEEAFIKYGYGYGGSKDGILLLLSIEYGDYYICTSGEGKDILSEQDIESMGSKFSDDFHAGEYSSLFSTFADECEYYIDGYLNGFPFGFGKNIIIAIVVGFVVAFIATGIMKSKLKSVRFNNRAEDYVKAGSMALTVSRDIYLYRNITRVPKPKSNSSSSGSSGRSFGGGGGRL